MYAAVIPKWVSAMIAGKEASIYGTGETSRDFCYIENVVQANLIAAAIDSPQAVNQVYNIAFSARTTLNTLFEFLRSRLLQYHPHLSDYAPAYREFRPGDIMHSHADISKAERLLGYRPTHNLEAGLDAALPWYCSRLN